MVGLRDALRKWREDEGLTQRQVAYLLGMSGSTRICVWETGAEPIPKKRVEQIKALIEPEPVSTWADVKQTPLNTLRAKAWECGWTISTAWDMYTLRKGKACVGHATLGEAWSAVQCIEAKHTHVHVHTVVATGPRRRTPTCWRRGPRRCCDRQATGRTRTGPALSQAVLPVAVGGMGSAHGHDDGRRSGAQNFARHGRASECTGVPKGAGSPGHPSLSRPDPCPRHPLPITPTYHLT